MVWHARDARCEEPLAVTEVDCLGRRQGAGEPDRIHADVEVAGVETVPHMQNFLECVRTRQQPIAPIEAGYAHSVAVIMADEALTSGRRMTYDPAKREIHPG